MMYEKDFLMRMVEAFSRLMAIILGFREKGDPDSAYGRIMEAYGSVLKVDPRELEGYTVKQWEMFCRERSLKEIEMLAELMKLEGEILSERGETDSVFGKLMKALDLLKFVDENSNTYSQERIDHIVLLEKKRSDRKR